MSILLTSCLDGLKFAKKMIGKPNGKEGNDPNCEKY